MGILFWAHFLNGFLMIAMPIVLGIYLARRFKLGWRLWWIGAATFVLSQVGHIPFNWVMSILLNKTALVNWPHTAQTVFNVVFLGLSAGLWEEGARYAMYRWWAKDARSWRKGLLTGAGHGGAEAIILGGLVLYGFIQMAAVRSTDLSTLVPANQLDLARQQVTAYWSATWYDSLLGALERLFTIPTQIAFAVIVLQAFTRKQGWWVWLAVGYHAVVDATAVLLFGKVGPYWTEAIIGGFAILSLVIIFVLRQPEPVPDPEPAPLIPVLSFTPQPVEETEENIEKTRYQ
jgi:uncharacterized membrane protein YhfC